jgi:hypothetical protein
MRLSAQQRNKTAWRPRDVLPPRLPRRRAASSAATMPPRFPHRRRVSVFSFRPPPTVPSAGGGGAIVELEPTDAIDIACPLSEEAEKTPAVAPSARHQLLPRSAEASKGLRQGDPLSPILFNLIVDMLVVLIERAKELSFFMVWFLT